MLFLKHHKGFPDARAPPACTSGKAFLMLPLDHWNFLTARDGGDRSWSQMARAWVVGRGEWKWHGRKCYGTDMPVLVDHG